MEDSTAAESGVEPEIVDAPAADEAEEIETPETDGEEAPEGENADEEGDDKEDEAEEIEFDFGGNKFKVKKGDIPENLAGELDKFAKGIWSDYTRKSQDAAERTKSIEARERAVEKLSSLNGDALQAFSRGLRVREEIEELSKIDLQSLWQSDPDLARRVSDEMSRKKSEFSTIVNQVQKAESELTVAQQQEVARRMDEGKQIIERRIKGFSQRVPEVIDYVTKTYGMTKEEAETWPLNPNTAEMAYKAMMYDRMQASSKAKPAHKAAPAQPTTPVKGKGGTASKDPAAMSVSELARHLGLPG